MSCRPILKPVAQRDNHGASEQQEVSLILHPAAMGHCLRGNVTSGSPLKRRYLPGFETIVPFGDVVDSSGQHGRYRWTGHATHAGRF